MKEWTIENISIQDLPQEWAKQMDAQPEERVNVTIQPAPPPRKKIDRDAVNKILEKIDALPVLDNRTPEEIIGYDENGLPT